jgi:Glycosyl transferase family 2
MFNYIKYYVYLFIMNIGVGVAVSCYFNHIPHLFNLLDSIEKQTLKPNKVVVSCSSTNKNIHFCLTEYSFPIEIITIEENKNASENRNIAISKLLDMDIVTFMDADDLMHPQRLEIITKVFEETDCDIVLHNFQEKEETTFESITDVTIKIDGLELHSCGCIIHTDNQYDEQIYKIHHSQSSVKKEILYQVRYREDKEYNRKEDCIFCADVFNLENIHNVHIKNVYLSNKLSYYRPSNSTMN